MTQSTPNTRKYIFLWGQKNIKKTHPKCFFFSILFCLVAVFGTQLGMGRGRRGTIFTIYIYCIKQKGYIYIDLLIYSDPPPPSCRAGVQRRVESSLVFCKFKYVNGPPALCADPPPRYLPGKPCAESDGKILNVLQTSCRINK